MTLSSKSSPQKLRHVIIGVGASVLGMHRAALALDTVELVGAADINETLGQSKADELGCPFFKDYVAMLEATKPDVAVVLAPHPFHANIAVNCFKAGAHVLVEKPMAVQISEADLMVKGAKEYNRLLAVNFQRRFRPEVTVMHAMLQSGQLGKLQHLHLYANWFRSRAYFQAAKWRATWRGEGGGVLMNQGIHDLDLMCYLLGSPKRLTAWTSTQLHSIEVEDTVQAMLEWDDGCTGLFRTSTAEVGAKDILELVGTRGTLRLTPEGLSGVVLGTPIEQFILEAEHVWMQPTQKPLELTIPEGKGDHTATYRHFHEAILEGNPLIISGEEARKSLELANAMIYSGQTGESVTLPLDGQRYSALLEKLRQSTTQQGATQQGATQQGVKA
ncbi:MAG: Gfo/Idh/MocA family protein [Trueperaceae bacterium]